MRFTDKFLPRKIVNLSWCFSFQNGKVHQNIFLNLEKLLEKSTLSGKNKLKNIVDSDFSKYLSI